jgi:acetyl esterase/lipase
MLKRSIFLGLLAVAILICYSLPTPLQSFETTVSTPIPTATSIPSTATQPQYPPVLSKPPVLGTEVHNLTYCTNDVPLKMDLYFPTSGAAPWTTVVYVHGGGWVGGDKTNPHAVDDIKALQASGYLVAAVDYRLTPRFPFPDMIVDVKCAVRFLRAHAAELQLDPEHIGAWGTSAGGHIVSLLGLAHKSAGWDTGQYLEQSSDIQAVVDMFGPTDLLHLSDELEAAKKTFSLFGGVEPTKSMLASASPVTYVSPGDPPFLIIHGEKDSVISPQQSILLYKRLILFNVPAKLILVANAGHGLSPVGGEIDPSRKQIIQSMIAFFDTYLKVTP